MVQTDFLVQNNSTHLLLNEYDDRFMKDHAFEKTASYIIRKNGAYYEAIKGVSTTGAGTIIYGGSANAGSVSGTDFSAVVQAAYNSLTEKRGTIFFGHGPFTALTTIQTANGSRQVTFKGIGWGNEGSRIKWGGSAGGYIFNTSQTGADVVFDNIDFDGNNVGGAVIATSSSYMTTLVFIHCQALRGIPGASSDANRLFTFTGPAMQATFTAGCFIAGEIAATNMVNYFDIFGGAIFGVKLYGPVSNADFHMYGGSLRYLTIESGEFYNDGLDGVFLDPTTEPYNLNIGIVAPVKGFSATNCVFNGGATGTILMDQAHSFTLYNPVIIPSAGYPLTVTSNALYGKIVIQEREFAKIGSTGSRIDVEVLGGKCIKHGVSYTISDGNTITHGMEINGVAVTPTAVFLQPNSSVPIAMSTLSIGSTTFTVKVADANPRTVYWTAIYVPFPNGF
jgi:hypothetical protein